MFDALLRMGEGHVVHADLLELQPDLLQRRTLSYTLGDRDPLWAALKESHDHILQEAAQAADQTKRQKVS